MADTSAFGLEIVWNVTELQPTLWPPFSFYQDDNGCDSTISAKQPWLPPTLLQMMCNSSENATAMQLLYAE